MWAGRMGAIGVSGRRRPSGETPSLLLAPTLQQDQNAVAGVDPEEGCGRGRGAVPGGTTVGPAFWCTRTASAQGVTIPFVGKSAAPSAVAWGLFVPSESLYNNTLH